MLSPSPSHSCQSASRLLPPPALPAHKARPTSLQLVQHIDSVVAVQVHLLRAAPPANVLHDVVRVCGTNDRDLGCKPLLERLCGEEAIGCKPLCHRPADVELLLRVGFVGSRSEDDVAFVDGDVLLGRRGNADLFQSQSVCSCV